MIFLKEFEPMTAAYAGMEMRPLVVRAVLKKNSPVVSYHPPPYLDNLLARVVVDRATNGAGLATSDEGYWIPLPLKAFWRSAAEGFPLWDCSVFEPEDPIPDMIYAHKRTPKAIYCEAKSIKPGVGRWMDRRLPLPVCVSPVWEARCIGNEEAVLELLGNISFLGKRRSIGMGEIEEWQVIPGDFETSFIINGRLAHAVPAGCGMDDLFDTQPTVVGWTPPQWKASLFKTGWPVGTSVKEVSYV